MIKMNLQFFAGADSSDTTKKYVSLTTLSTFLDNLNDTFAEETHTHKVSELTDYTVDTELSSTSTNPVQNKVLDAEFESVATAMGALETAIDNVEATALNKYAESIIALSVDGQTVTYIKGDGSTHTFTTQDTNTEYFLATDETSGLTKLYATVGDAEDGTMTQKAIKTELDKKVGVDIDESQNVLIFTT